MGGGGLPGAVVGVGVDVVEIGRIARAAERFGARFLERVYAPDELAYCRQRGRRPEQQAGCLAGRFAAKEAVMKALGTGARGVSFHEIVVTRLPGGRPGVSLLGRAAAAARRQGVDEISLSISHGREVAVAVALALRHARGQDGV